MSSMNQASSVRRIGDLTRDQWGLVTRRQLEDAGFASTTIERLTVPGGVLEKCRWGIPADRGRRSLITGTCGRLASARPPAAPENERPSRA